MRVEKILQTRIPKSSLHETTCLDLSNLGIGIVDSLCLCPKLQTLYLNDNNLLDVDDIVHCANLWKIDLSNNKLSLLYSISRFYAIGCLVLCNNELNWLALSKIRHVMILNLYLSGNPGLSDDPHYRIHVIDSLPNVWALDGKIITAAERKLCDHFFHNRAASNRPVRHKSCEPWSTVRPGSEDMKDRLWGTQTKLLFKLFSEKAEYNFDLDIKRLEYLGFDLQNEFIIDDSSAQCDQGINIFNGHQTYIEDLMKARPMHLNKYNMILVLLVGSLEFSLPKYLVKITLSISNMDRLGGLNIMDIFLLPRDKRSQVACLLLNAAKIDRDLHVDDSINDYLYLALFYILGDLSHIRFTSVHESPQSPRHSPQEMGHRRLLAAEIVQLFCVVPEFYTLITNHQGLDNILVMATWDECITEEITYLKDDTPTRNEAISELLQLRIEKNIDSLFSRKISPTDQVLCKAATSNVNAASPMLFAKYHSEGKPSPNILPSQIKPPDQIHFPHLGDTLLLSPLTTGTILSLPEPFVSLVKVNEVPAVNGGMVSQIDNAEDHYWYIDMSRMKWCEGAGQWKPKDTVGDRITLNTVNDFIKGSHATSERTTVDVSGVLLANMTKPKVSKPLNGPQTKQNTQTQGSDKNIEKDDSMVSIKIDLSNSVDNKHNVIDDEADSERETKLDMEVVVDEEGTNGYDVEDLNRTDSHVADENDKIERFHTGNSNVTESGSPNGHADVSDVLDGNLEADVNDSRSGDSGDIGDSVVVAEVNEGSVINGDSHGKDSNITIDDRQHDEGKSNLSDDQEQNLTTNIGEQMVPSNQISHEVLSENITDESENKVSKERDASSNVGQTEVPTVEGDTCSDECLLRIVNKIIESSVKSETILKDRDQERRENSASKPQNEWRENGAEDQESGKVLQSGTISETSAFVQYILRNVSPDPPPSSPIGSYKRIRVLSDATKQRESSYKDPDAAGSKPVSKSQATHSYSVLDNYSRMHTEAFSQSIRKSARCQNVCDTRPKSSKSVSKPYGSTSVRKKLNKDEENTLDAFKMRVKLPKIGIRYYQQSTTTDHAPDKHKKKDLSSRLLHTPHNSPRCIALGIRRGTKWLGAGRDLHSEMLDKRPRTPHIPGWLDGLQENPLLSPRIHNIQLLPNIMLFSKDRKTQQFVYKHILGKDIQVIGGCDKCSHENRNSNRSPTGMKIWNQMKKRVESVCFPCLQKSTLMVVE